MIDGGGGGGGYWGLRHLFFPSSKFVGQFSRHGVGVSIVYHQPLSDKQKNYPPPPIFFLDPKGGLTPPPAYAPGYIVLTWR